jgi:hypothetical protein
LEWWQNWRNWKAQVKQSWIILPLSTYWFLCTSLRMTDCSLADNNLVIHLTE